MGAVRASAANHALQCLRAGSLRCRAECRRKATSPCVRDAGVPVATNRSAVTDRRL